MPEAAAGTIVTIPSPRGGTSPAEDRVIFSDLKIRSSCYQKSIAAFDRTGPGTARGSRGRDEPAAGR